MINSARRIFRGQRRAQRPSDLPLSSILRRVSSRLSGRSSKNRDLPERPRDVPLAEFPDYVRMMQRDSGLMNERQFELLGRQAQDMERREKLTLHASGHQQNLTKNRFTNILPFDHSRLRLVVEDDSNDSITNVSPALSPHYTGIDYINANYMMGYHGKREFIASQGPLPSTVDDFWRMLWEQNVRCVVMLTQLRERQRPKCECYWPLDTHSANSHFEGLTVRLISESTLNAYMVRILEASLGGETRRITQLHYLHWMDFSAPILEEFWEFLRDFRNHVPHDVDAPIVVHCSAGVGRTGTLIVLDRVIHLLRAGATTINVCAIIMEMRYNRRFMVQNFRQLAFIYDFLKWYLENQLQIGVEPEHDSVTSATDDHVYMNFGDMRPADAAVDNNAFLKEDPV